MNKSEVKETKKEKYFNKTINYGALHVIILFVDMDFFLNSGKKSLNRRIE